MQDLIDRQAAIDALTRTMVSIPTAGGKDLMDDVNRIRAEDIAIIKRLPSAQPEVIRCGECKCWRELPNGCQGFCDMHSTYPTLTDFCSWAERREDNK